MSTEPKQTWAVEYDGRLYRTLREAEQARAKAVLLALLPPLPDEHFSRVHGGAANWYTEAARSDCIDCMIKSPRSVINALARIPE
jgi:hypothetical protein